MLLKMRMFLFVCLLCVVSLAAADPPIQLQYLKPSDVAYPTQDELNELLDVMREVQSFYASEMDRHGFGPKTFDFNPDIEVTEGRRTADEYSDVDSIKNETFQIDFDIQNKIDVVFLAGRKRVSGGALGFQLPQCWFWPGQAQDKNNCNHLVVIPVGYKEFLLPTTAHEIAHTFGLSHVSKKLTSNRRIDIMYPRPVFYEGVKAELEDFAFSFEDAKVLNESDVLSVAYGRSNEPTQEPTQDLNADVNDDGYVDLYDVLIVRSGMQNSSTYDTDINNDGVTDEVDLMIVKAKAYAAIAAAAPPKRRVNITTLGALKRQ